MARYPKYICGDCYGKAADKSGRALSLYNGDHGYGFKAHFTDDNTVAEEVTKSQVVYVDGNRCWADEARFGGVVVQLLADGEDGNTLG